MAAGDVTDGVDQPWVEEDRRKTRQLGAVDSDAFCAGVGCKKLLYVRFGTVECIVIGVAQIERERDSVRDDVDGTRREFECAHRRHGGRALYGVAPQGGDDLGCHYQRVVAQVERGSPGVIGDAAQGDALPRDALQGMDSSERYAACSEDGTLLDVELEVGVDGETAGHHRAGIPDAHEFVAVACTVGTDEIEHSGDGHAAGHR